MAEELLNGINIGCLIQQVGGKAVPKGMDAMAFVYAGFFFAM
jgi:hypothetical protein